MASPYLSMLSDDLKTSLENCRNLKRICEDFLHDYPFVEGMSENFPKSCIWKAIERSDSLGKTIEEFLKLLEENNNERRD